LREHGVAEAHVQADQARDFAPAGDGVIQHAARKDHRAIANDLDFQQRALAQHVVAGDDRVHGVLMLARADGCEKAKRADVDSKKRPQRVAKRARLMPGQAGCRFVEQQESCPNGQAARNAKKLLLSERQ